MVAIVTIFLLILFAGKKTYTVTFDLNGGELLGGNVVQTVTRGQNATPPVVTKEGCYLRGWSDSHVRVSRDVYTIAVWEYSTTPGIIYEVLPNSTYCVISGCFKELSGPVYIGAYYNNMKVLGIKAGAFEGCKNITSIHLLDGIISIGEGAFSGCSSLESISLPNTVENIGDKAFVGCDNLKEITIPRSVKKMGMGVFRHEITINVYHKKGQMPLDWNLYWCYGNPTIVYDYQSVLDGTNNKPKKVISE
jgi:hypothetical protein